MKYFFINLRTLARMLFSCSLFFIILSVHIPPDAVFAASSAGELLIEKYHTIKGELEKNDFGLPLYIESYEEKNSLRGDVYGIIDYPFDAIQDILQSPVSWCDIVLLHLNIKACIHWQHDGDYFLTFYSGRKFYQDPQDAYRLEYRLKILTKHSEYFSILLSADNGPLNTKDHRIGLESMHLEKGKTLIHLSYSYKYGLLGRLATKSYFATLGVGKIGFSVVAKDSPGNPVYATGIRGAIERNSVRYYFAIQAYLHSLTFPEEERFSERISHWYDLTDLFKRQLFEMEKEEYIRYKEMEYQNQLLLQKELKAHRE